MNELSQYLLSTQPSRPVSCRCDKSQWWRSCRRRGRPSGRGGRISRTKLPPRWTLSLYFHLGVMTLHLQLKQVGPRSRTDAPPVGIQVTGSLPRCRVRTKDGAFLVTLWRPLSSGIPDFVIKGVGSRVRATLHFSAWLTQPVKMYRDEINSLQIQLSMTQAGPGRAVKEQQEQNSPNHVQRINLISVHGSRGQETISSLKIGFIKIWVPIISLLKVAN